MSFTPKIYVFDKFVLNENTHELSSNGLPIELTTAEYDLLLYFLKYPQVPHRYGDLYENVLGLTGRANENSIPTHVSNLRKKLRKFSNRKLIKNIPRLGYKFTEKPVIENNVEDLHDPTGNTAGGEDNYQLRDSPGIAESDPLTEHGLPKDREHSVGEPVKVFYLEKNSKQFLLIAGFLVLSLTGLYLLRNSFQNELMQPAERSADEGDKKKQDDTRILFEKVEFISPPVANKELFLYITGENIDPETVSLKVVGPGCGGNHPCEVPNGALRLHGSVNRQFIEKAPVTLAPGDYDIWLENSPGDVSNKLTISVPQATP